MVTLPRSVLFACCVALAACGDPANVRTDASGADGSGGGLDSSVLGSDGGGNGADGSGIDAGAADGSTSGLLTGGPCISGQAGATAYRVRWIQAGSSVQVVYEKNGLPDTSRDKTAAYGYQIGFTPQFVDPFLGDGGVLLNGSSFIDIELSTAGVAQIDTATLSIFGRSYNTTASGSFNWQTFAGTGSTPTNAVSNVAPYNWYSADMTTEIDAGDNGVLLRIKAGPNSGSLVVHRIELCMEAS